MRAVLLLVLLLLLLAVSEAATTRRRRTSTTTTRRTTSAPSSGGGSAPTIPSQFVEVVGMLASTFFFLFFFLFHVLWFYRLNDVFVPSLPVPLPHSQPSTTQLALVWVWAGWCGLRSWRLWPRTRCSAASPRTTWPRCAVSASEKTWPGAQQQPPAQTCGSQRAPPTTLPQTPAAHPCADTTPRQCGQEHIRLVAHFQPRADITMTRDFSPPCSRADIGRQEMLTEHVLTGPEEEVSSRQFVSFI